MRARVLCRFEEARADLQCDVYPCTWHVQTCRAICWLAYGVQTCIAHVHACRAAVLLCMCPSTQAKGTCALAEWMCWLAFATCMKARGAYRLAERYAGLHTGVKTCTGLCTLAERLCCSACAEDASKRHVRPCKSGCAGLHSPRSAGTWHVGICRATCWIACAACMRAKPRARDSQNKRGGVRLKGKATSRPSWNDIMSTC